MARLATLGKISRTFFDDVISPRLGHRDDSILVGPRTGVDCGVVRVAPGLVMAMTTDPVFVVPAYGWERSAWFAVHIIASDIATSGLKPRYLTVDLNLPPSMTEGDLETFWEHLHRSCEAIEMSIVTGHTGRYEGCNYPMIGGATAVAIGREADYVSSGMSRPDDVVIVTKGAAIEATALMAVTFPERVRGALGATLADQASSLFYHMSTVADARAATSVGVRDSGVTAMHDATEGGILNGLWELATTAGIGMEIDARLIPMPAAVDEVCRLFDMNPFAAISEGTLLLTCRPNAAEPVLAALRGEGILAAQVGTCRPDRELWWHEDGVRKPLQPPVADPFWAAFAHEHARGSS